VTESKSLDPDDRGWLLHRLAETKQRYAELPRGLAHCAVHGDAWAGNIVVTASGAVILDLERFAYGPPEWDLSGVAVDYTTFAYLDEQQWHEFSETYGCDVTTWAGFEVLRDARELRKVTFAYQRPDIAEQAAYRLACIRGNHGPRPWQWTGLT
jgi:aminoglycoside phosphotransferase (APT) family kinase protein